MRPAYDPTPPPDPAGGPRPSEPSAAGASGPWGGPRGRRLLVADDDAGLRRGVIDLLDALELEILEADSGPAALAIAREGRLHAALLDLHMPGDAMPGLGGLEVLEVLGEAGAIRRPLPCILYSADLTPDLEARVRLAGASAVLHKPVDPERLRAEVRRALGVDTDRSRRVGG